MSPSPPKRRPSAWEAALSVAFVALVWLLAEALSGEARSPAAAPVGSLVTGPAGGGGPAGATDADAALAGQPGAAEPLSGGDAPADPAPWRLVGRPLVISGRTVDALGRPLAGARVVFVPSGETCVASDPSSQGRLPALDLLPSVVSDADGRFEVTGACVPGGTGPSPSYSGNMQPTRLAADAPGCVRATPRLVLPDVRQLPAGDAPIRLDAGDVRLVPGGRLVGRLVDGEGRPLEGLTIDTQHVRRSDTDEPCPDADLVPEGRTRSGPDGRFSLDGQWTHRRRLLVNGGGHEALKPWAEARLGETVDLGDLKLRFSGRLSGRVRDERGQPVPGATVLVRHRAAEHLEQDSLLRDRLSHDLARDEGPRLTTDAEGRFVAERLSGPQQYLLVGAPWCEPALVSGVLTGSEDVVVTLPDAARALIHVVDAESGRTLSGATVTGGRDVGLFGAAHVPTPVVSGAELQRALAERPLRRPAAVEKPVLAPPPETGGRFLAELGHRLGSRFEASLPGYARGLLDVPGGALGAVVEVTLPLQPGATVKGSVRKADGGPVEGARVVCVSLDDDGSDGVWQALSQADGRYELADLPAGGFRIWLQGLVGAGLAAGPPVEVRLDAGQRLAGVDLAVVVGGLVEGRALEADGSPRVGLRVQLRPDRAGHGERHVVTDTSGGFCFGDVPPGLWHVGDGDRERGDLPVQVAAGETASVELRRSAGAWLTGVVTDRLTGEPLEGVRVAQAADDSAFEAGRHTADFVTLTDASGRFAARRQSLGWYGPSDLWLYTQVPGSQVVAQRPLDGALDADVDVAVEIGGSTLSLTVTDALSGDPLPDVRVRLGRDRLDVIDRGLGEQYLDVTTDSDGRLTLEHLQPGRCAVRLDGPDHAPQWTLVVLAEGHNEVALQAVPSAAIEGVLVHEDGAPVWEGSRLEFRWQGAEADSEQQVQLVTVVDGRFGVAGLTPGVWRVSAVDEQLEIRLVLPGREGRDLELAPGQTLTLDCVLLDDF